MHGSQWYICFSDNVHRCHSNNSYGTAVSVILSINCQISSFLYYFSFASNLEIVIQNYAV